MFYSHTFLSRKGPLGTVWIAAHLQHKLRKSQVAIVDISSSVDRIIFPEVPIALRLSGFLLLGVVRIYSKKVDYLYHDCNEVFSRIRAAFASIHVNLLEDANQAPFHSVTLPERFELDALDIDDSFYHAETPDNHLRTHEEITITDRISGEGNPNMAFSVDEDALMDISQTETPQLRAEPMEEDFLRLFSGREDKGVAYSNPSNQAEECSQRLHEDHLSNNLPEIEVLRDFVQSQPFGVDNVPVWHDVDKDVVGAHEPFSPTTSHKESHSPTAERFSDSGIESLPSPSLSTPMTAKYKEQHGTSDLGVSLGPLSSEMAIQPTSPELKERANSMKRKRPFDESLVLTNELMKKQLQDASKLLRKRKNLPIRAVDVWKSYKRSRLGQLLVEPTLTGMCDDLHEVLKKGLHAIHPNLTEALLEPRHAISPHGKPAFEKEIEQPRFEEEHVDGSLPEFIPCPSGVEFTPISSSNLGTVLETGKSLESEALPTPELVPSGLDGTKHETPTLFSDQEQHAGNTEFPDFCCSAEAEVLKFLESDNTQAGHEDEVHALSARTRAVAQYLMTRSPDVSVGHTGDSVNISLNRIMEGKTRKQCARMLFETLVLVTCRFINVQQQETYADILLSLTPEILKAKF